MKLCEKEFVLPVIFEENVAEKTQVRACFRRQLSGGVSCFFTVLMSVISPASCSELETFRANSAKTNLDMAEEAPAAAPAKAAAKAPKKKAAPKAKKDGPSIQKLIVSAVTDCKERKGVSLAALKKVLAGKGVDVSKANKRINTAVTKLVTKGTLSQTKGTGASGSFKLAKQEPKAAKPAKKVVKKKAPAKAKKPAAAKKTTAAKKPAAKKPKAVKKSPKKAPAKKAAVKKVAKSPKKAAPKKPKVVKKPAAKKAPAKKPAAKKAKK